MKNLTTQILSFSLFAILLSGCYTQLEVVERPAPQYVQHERPQPNRAYNPHDEIRLDEHGYAIDGFSDESYYAGYDDGFTDLEIYFRDYSRQPVMNRSNQYDLGYYDGYRDASWSFHRHRYHTRYYGPHWDPFWYSGHSTFFVSWGWHRPHHFWHHSPHHFYGFYSYPVFYHGHHGFYGWGGHRNTWIVYNYNVINNNQSVNRGPRNSGIARDRVVTGRNTASTGTRSDARPSTSTTRSSGVSRDNTEVRRGAPAQTGRTRGTVTRSPSTEGRSSGTTRSGSGVREGGSSSGSSGSVQRGTSTGRSSGTVRSGGNRSGGSSSDSAPRRPRGNDLQSSNDIPVVLPGNTNSRERITQERPAVQQPPRTAATRNRSGVTVSNSTAPVNTPRVRDDNNDRPTAVQRQNTSVERSSTNTVTRTEGTSPARSVAQPQRQAPAARPAPQPQRQAPAAQPAPQQRQAPAARPAPQQRQAPAAQPAPQQRQAPAARPAPQQRQAPAARPAPQPQRQAPAAQPAPQRNNSNNDSGNSNRNRNRD